MVKLNKMSQFIRIKEIVSDEQTDIEWRKKELEEIKKKWFKFSSHIKLIEFLESYIKLKEKLLDETKKIS